MKKQPEVLFVCVQNAGRSQMAAGLVKLRSDGRIHVRSAGSQPADEITTGVSGNRSPRCTPRAHQSR